MTWSMLDGDGDEKEPKRCAFSIVRAIGEFYFFFFVFFILTHILLYIEIIIYLIHDMERVVW